MKTRRRFSKKRLIALVALLTAGRGWCADSSNSADPLLDLFVKKGYVTQEEADQVKAEADFQKTNGLANYSPTPTKWDVTPGIKNMELYGDVRLRFENRSAEDPFGGKIDLNRLRFALRFGLRGDAFDNFYYGFRLETSSNPRSPWVTLATQSGSSTPYQEPFGKSASGIGVGQAYLGWRWEDYVDVTLGAMPNLLYTTPMVWDNDLNPVGAFERFKYPVGQANFFATFGQLLYQDSNPTSAANGYFDGLTQTTGKLPFLLAWQGGFSYRITPAANLKIAPVLYQYINLQDEGTPATGGVGADYDGTFVGQGGSFGVDGAKAAYNLASSGTPGFDGFFANQTGLNDLLVLDIPAEFNLKVDDLNVRFFGDYAYNFHGAQRAEAAYNAQSAEYFQNLGYTSGLGIPSAQTRDVHAYQFGIGIGSRDLDYGPEQGLVYGTSSQKHDWELRTYWQHIEQYSLDPNLIDSDFFEGAANLQGVYVALSYAFANNVFATLRYGYASRINHNLGTGTSDADIPQMNPINQYNVFQADASIRF